VDLNDLILSFFLALPWLFIAGWLLFTNRRNFKLLLFAVTPWLLALAIPAWFHFYSSHRDPRPTDITFSLVDSCMLGFLLALTTNYLTAILWYLYTDITRSRKNTQAPSP
jgi:hypothetical protein